MQKKSKKKLIVNVCITLATFALFAKRKSVGTIPTEKLREDKSEAHGLK